MIRTISSSDTFDPMEDDDIEHEPIVDAIDQIHRNIFESSRTRNNCNVDHDAPDTMNNPSMCYKLWIKSIEMKERTKERNYFHPFRKEPKHHYESSLVQD